MGALADISKKLICCRKRSSDAKDGIQTHWSSIYICSIFTILDGIQYSMVIVSMWPYLKTIDPSSTVTMYGFVMAAFSFGQAIGSPLFGFWSNKVKSIKPPLTCTLSLMMIGNIFYGCLELFPVHDRAYILIAARFVSGFATGDVAVMRSYSVTAAIKSDRPKSVVAVSAAWNIGMTLGPVVPVIFSPLGYPGWKISEHLHIDMYTAPAWLSLINNIICMILLRVFLKEKYILDENKTDDSFEEPKMPLSKKLTIFWCIATRFLLFFVYTNTETIGSLYVMLMYNWSNAQAVRYYGLITLGQGLLTFIGGLVLYFGLSQYIGRKGLERFFILFGLTMMTIFYLLTFPWPSYKDMLTYEIKNTSANSTEIYGCDPKTYDFCTSTHKVPLILYAFGMIVVFAGGYNFSFNPLSIYYTKVLGNTRQGTMTGILFMAGSLARALGPLVVSPLFDRYGPEMTWGMEIAVLLATMLPWGIFYRKLGRATKDPKDEKGEEK